MDYAEIVDIKKGVKMKSSKTVKLHGIKENKNKMTLEDLE